MGRKRKKRVEEDEFIDEEEGWLKKETKLHISAIIILVVAILLLFAPTGNGGVVGNFTVKWLSFLFGSGYWLLPAILMILAITLFRSIKPKLIWTNIIGGVILLFSGLGMADLFFENEGGVVGKGIGKALAVLFGGVIAKVFVVALMIISILVILNSKIAFGEIFGKLFKKKEIDENDAEMEDLEDEPVEEYDEEEEVIDEDEEEGEPEEEEEESFMDKLPLIGKKKGKKSGSHTYLKNPYSPPPLSLLSRESGKPSAGDIKANSNIIKRTLANFGIEVEMDEVLIGPSITRYSMKPAEGVKLSRITNLQKELSLALAAHPLRVEAPIPGKSLVGIEIPNTTKTTVRLGSLLSQADFTESGVPLLAALGKDIAGLAHYINLAKMPHTLIAGTTGSGKSVAIHSIITSLLYKNSPEQLRFILIDPKRVELTLYNNIPHLLTPVITQAKKAILSLKWAAKEMDRRYDILEEEKVRDINSYHENVLAPAMAKFRKKAENMTDEEFDEYESQLPESMPYIVVVIDELADIMTSYPRELEAAIVRLAQMSRAVGIHLVLSTQRPSTEVITGLIKANVPARVALQVPSQIDSRTIIDMPGAEKLLGSGDMLFISSDSSKPTRIQSAFISEPEVKNVATYLADTYEDDVPDELDFSDTAQSGGGLSVSLNSDDDNEDELYEDARETVIKMKKASTSLLQRKLKVGYARAARLIDMLEERGVVGPADGAKPREVYEQESNEVDDLADNFDGSYLPNKDDSESEYEEEEER